MPSPKVNSHLAGASGQVRAEQPTFPQLTQGFLDEVRGGVLLLSDSGCVRCYVLLVSLLFLLPVYIFLMLGMWGLAAVLLLMLDMVPSVELLGVGIATVVTLPYLLNKKVLVGAKNQLCNMA